MDEVQSQLRRTTLGRVRSRRYGPGGPSVVVGFPVSRPLSTTGQSYRGSLETEFLPTGKQRMRRLFSELRRSLLSGRTWGLRRGPYTPGRTIPLIEQKVKGRMGFMKLRLNV